MRIYPLSSNKTYVKQNFQPQFQGFKLPKITKEQHCELGVFLHHIYEYKKGLRNLILTTERIHNQEFIECKLINENIPYVIQPVGSQKNTINVYFGNEDCINVVKTFKKPLNQLSNEQDFMLGIMLGYDRILQCQRYLKRLGQNLNPLKG